MIIQSVKEIIKKANNAYKKGNYVQAADLFSQASISYTAQNNELLSAEMKNNQSVAFLLGKDPQNALDACKGTAEFFIEQNDKKRAGIAFANEAAAYEGLESYELAVEKYNLSADILKSIGEKEMYAHIFQSLSQLQVRMGKHFEALSSMKINIENTEKKSFKQKLLNFALKIQKTLLP